MEGYFITKDQLDEINHYKRMFELNAEHIADLILSKKTLKNEAKHLLQTSHSLEQSIH